MNMYTHIYVIYLRVRFSSTCRSHADSGEQLYHVLGIILKAKFGDADATFKDLYDGCGVELAVSVFASISPIARARVSIVATVTSIPSLTLAPAPAPAPATATVIAPTLSAPAEAW